MGYHRDGEITGLQPFEVEMRRRIWWYILKQDARLSDAAAPTMSILPSMFDKKPPSNINDVDMHPATSELPSWNYGPTEMSFVLLRNEVHICRQTGEAGLGVSDFALAMVQGSIRTDCKDPEELMKLNLEDLEDAARAFDGELAEMESQYVDASAGGVHGAARCVRPLLASKWVDILKYLDRRLQERDTGALYPSVILYEYLVTDVECKLDVRDRMSALGFGWYMNVRFELDHIATMIAKTRHEPTGLLAERAWRALERVYDQNPELFDLSNGPYSLLADYVQEAWSVRVEALMQSGYMTQLPNFMLRIQSIRDLEAQLDIC